MDFDVKFENFKDNLIYIDTIYNPITNKNDKTFKIKKYKNFQRIVLDMFIYQGQKSFIYGTRLILK